MMVSIHDTPSLFYHLFHKSQGLMEDFLVLKNKRAIISLLQIHNNREKTFPA